MLLLSNRGNFMISSQKDGDSLNRFLQNLSKGGIKELGKRRDLCLFSSIRLSYKRRFFTSCNSLDFRCEKIWALKQSEKATLLQPIFSSSSRFVGNTFERFETFRDPEKFQEIKLITLRLASPDTIRRWAETRLPNGKVVGLVHNANTLHHNTLKPLKGGLFCERIFGPTKDFQCACGIQKEKNFSRITSTRLFCLKCDVEYTWSLKRRYQSGYIRLVSPVAHLWYVKETPSFIAVMLDMKRKTLDSVIYCSSTLTLDSSMIQLKNNFMYSKTAVNWAAVDIPQTQVNRSKQDLKENNYIPTFISGAENLPFFKNLFWLKTNRKKIFGKKQNEIETSDSAFSNYVKIIKPFKTKSVSYEKSRDLPLFLLANSKGIIQHKKWTNFWTIAYKIAKKQIAMVIERTKLKQVEATKSLRPSVYKIGNMLELAKTKGDEKFFDLKLLTYKEFLLVFYAQKTSKLFKNGPKFSRKEKSSHKRKLSFLARIAVANRDRSYFSKKSKVNAFLDMSRFALQVNSGESPFVKKRAVEANFSLFLLNNLSPFLHLNQEDKKESVKLHLSITTFPVFLHIVMYLFQHCYNFDQSEIIVCRANEKIVNTREKKGLNRRDVSLGFLLGNSRCAGSICFSIRFFYSFLRKQNILLSSLIVKLKDIIKYWFIFKNFIFFQSIFIKNNYFLKTILGNLNEFHYVLPENKLDSPIVFQRKDVFFVRKPMVKSQIKAFNLRFGITCCGGERTPLFLASYKNSSFFEQFSFWAKEFQLTSVRHSLTEKTGNKMLIVEKRFLMFKYFNKISLTSNDPNISHCFEQISRLAKLIEPERNCFRFDKSLLFPNRRIFDSGLFSVGRSPTEPRRDVNLFSFHTFWRRHFFNEKVSSVNTYFRLKQNKFKQSFYQRELSFFLCVKLFQQLKVFKHLLSFSQVFRNFEVNEHKIYTNHKFVVSKEKIKYAKINYFFGEIQSFGLPRFADNFKMLQVEDTTKFEAKNTFLDFIPDNLTLLNDKLNNSLVEILLENKFFGIMNFSNTINNINSFNKTWYSKRNPFSGVFDVNLTWMKIDNSPVNDIVYLSSFFERSLVRFFKKEETGKKYKGSFSLQVSPIRNEKRSFSLQDRNKEENKFFPFRNDRKKEENKFSPFRNAKRSFALRKPIFLFSTMFLFFSTLRYSLAGKKDGGSGSKIQLGLVEKLLRFEKLNMNLILFNTLNKNFTVLKAVKPIYKENYISLTTVLKNMTGEVRGSSFSTFEQNAKKETSGAKKSCIKRSSFFSLRSEAATFPNFASFDKLIYFQSLEKGYLDLFFSLYFKNFSVISSKFRKYTLVKRWVLIKNQLAFEISKTERVSPISELQKNQIGPFIYSNSFNLGKKTKLNETFDPRGYLYLKKSNFSLHKYGRFIARKRWNSFYVEEKGLFPFSSYSKANFMDFKFSKLTKARKQFGFSSFVYGQRFVSLQKSDRFLSGKYPLTGSFSNKGRLGTRKVKLFEERKALLSSLSASRTLLNQERRVATRLYNNIYVLSNRYFWDLEEDLLTFLHYVNEPPSPSDVCIPTYADRLLKSNLFRDPPPVLGGGLIQKFLVEFHPNECSKILMVLEKSLKTVNLLLRSCDDFLETRTLRLKRNYILRRLKYIRSGSYKFTDDFLRFSINKTSKEISNRKFVTIANTLNTTFKLKNLRSFLKESRPEWMVLSLLPVLPPDLRPILQIGNQVAASDLNRLYQKVIYRNERLKRFLKDSTSTNSPQIKFAYRLLQEAVDNLIDNGKGKGTPETDNRGLPLKSLTELLKGKKGRFRQNLLGKRVDYSGRSVIVVGPRLRLHECGLPKEMAIELFLPFLIQKIFQSGKAVTILGAKLLLKTDPTQTWEFLTMVLRENPVLLNRAPTLHRFGFQAFQPRLVEGKAILLHPLVCPAFNADFDGDQMAVHVPITAEAKVEAWKLMLARNHLLSASTGEGMLLPSQDMVLGCYYLTATNPTLYKKTSFLHQYNYLFTSVEEVLQAYESQKINLHSFIWLRWDGKFQTNEPAEKLLELQISTKGHIAKILKNYVIYVDSSGSVQSIFIKTTPGRVLFYNFLFKS